MNLAALPSAIRSRMVHSVHRFLQIAPLFEGASRTRNRTQSNTGSTDSRADVSRLTRTEITGAARWLFNNEGVLRGICWDMARYSVGAHGLRPQSMSGNPEFDAAAEDYWWAWCKVADASGKFHFSLIQLLLSVSMDRDGDVGIKLSKSASGFPQVQLIESHRIGSPADKESEGWFDGVRLNDVGRPVAYRVYTRGNTTRTDLENSVEVPANDFILLYDPQRTDQTRGLSAFAHGLLHIHDKKDILGFEKSAVKVNSAWPAVLKKKGGSVDAADWNAEGQSSKDSATKLSLAQITEGQMPVIDGDEELIQWLQSRPGVTFSGFLDYLIREVNVGLGLPVEFTWDPSKLGGTSQRFVLAKAQRRFEERQQLLISRVLNRLWFWVISVGIQRGDLVLPAGAKHWNVRWQAPSELTVDAGRDAKADREDVLAGLMSRSEHYGRRGLDWEEAHDQIEKEAEDILTRAQALAKKFGVQIDAALSLLQQRGPNPAPLEKPEPPPAATPAQKDEPAPSP
jgi:lambda family phage portal protein